MEPIDELNPAGTLATFADHRGPRVVAGSNGHDAMVVKAQGGFVRHAHPGTDDPFLVPSDRFHARRRDRSVVPGPGELSVVPRGVEHRPFAEEDTHPLLDEPAGTPNTDDPATAAPRRQA